jgi:acyl CoA:acetate/3-ketoacid CoA transferase
LEAKAVELIEVAPGIDAARDILPQMELPVIIRPNVTTMDLALFREWN